MLRIGILACLGATSMAAFNKAIAQSTETLHPEIAPPQPEVIETPTYLRPSTTCPRAIEPLMSGLLRDLPGYANRVAYRSLGISADATGFGTLLIAGQAEFDPLDVSILTLSDESDVSPETIQQAFFTTLEWQYTQTDPIPIEQYHWLFLTEAADGWRLALMFSRVANDTSTDRPPTPPQESSDGIVGQAVRLWLRDCRAGAVYPMDSADVPITESEVLTEP